MYALLCSINKFILLQINMLKGLIIKDMEIRRETMYIIKEKVNL